MELDSLGIGQVYHLSLSLFISAVVVPAVVDILVVITVFFVVSLSVSPLYPLSAP